MCIKQHVDGTFTPWTSDIFLLILYIQTEVIHQYMDDITYYNNASMSKVAIVNLYTKYLYKSE